MLAGEYAELGAKGLPGVSQPKILLFWMVPAWGQVVDRNFRDISHCDGCLWLREY